MRILAALALSLLALPLAAQSLEVRHPDGRAVTVTSAQLETLPRQLGSVALNGKTVAYEGVLLRDVLRLAGLPAVDSLRGPRLAQTLVVRAADGYVAAIALSDLDASIGARRAVLVDREDGAPLPPERGPFRLIIEGDVRPARWVRQVTRLDIVDLR